MSLPHRPPVAQYRAGVFRAQARDWRSVVDRVMNQGHDSEVFDVAFSGLPLRKQHLVEGRDDSPASRDGASVAVKIVDMLGEATTATKRL